MILRHRQQYKLRDILEMSQQEIMFITSGIYKEIIEKAKMESGG